MRLQKEIDAAIEEAKCAAQEFNNACFDIWSSSEKAREQLGKSVIKFASAVSKAEAAIKASLNPENHP